MDSLTKAQQDSLGFKEENIDLVHEYKIYIIV